MEILPGQILLSFNSMISDRYKGGKVFLIFLHFMASISIFGFIQCVGQGEW